jgi:phospholipid transport system substrate-binding protein
MNAHIQTAASTHEKLHRFLRVAGVAFLLSLFATVAHGAPAAVDPAGQFIQALGTEALNARTLPDGERAERVRSLVRDNIDVPSIGRFMLGAYWRTASEEQRQRYLGLLETSLVHTYDRRFGGQSFRVERVARDGEDMLVRSEIGQTNGRPAVTVEWRVRAGQGQLKIEDIIVDGMSLSIEHRGDFAAIIDRGGGNVEALLTALENN